MTEYCVALLTLGVILLLVGILGQVKAKEIEVGTNNKLARLIIGFIGVIFICISMYLFLPSAPKLEPPISAGSKIIDTPNKKFEYIGCYKDNYPRDLNEDLPEDDKMTTEKCVEICKKKGFSYAGTQFSRYCFCGNSYGGYGKADNCNMHCSGDSNEKCGGYWANSVYKINK